MLRLLFLAIYGVADVLGVRTQADAGGQVIDAPFGAAHRAYVATPVPAA